MSDVETGRHESMGISIKVSPLGAEADEAAALVAAIERFRADTTPPATTSTQLNPWLRAALYEGVSAKQSQR